MGLLLKRQLRQPNSEKHTNQPLFSKHIFSILSNTGKNLIFQITLIVANTFSYNHCKAPWTFVRTYSYSDYSIYRHHLCRQFYYYYYYNVEANAQPLMYLSRITHAWADSTTQMPHEVEVRCIKNVFVVKKLHVVFPYPLCILLAGGNLGRLVHGLLAGFTSLIEQHVRTVGLFEWEIHELLCHCIVGLGLK